ncbi:DNA-processing protein DprA [Leisingera aquaemixtae]|uniref:DNA-processing protein DprA n=1 Tax=Leisingera aquaemixtae TaxID=1396826 RepID=A0ABY5WGD8_9RHOB|nr:DNA-processing protein DprA [Leisingera aquaemixtae]UWQ23860.1 DNA-processing protein DprA [Leisingera aquaemixtae]UWQ40489.1 DNA-processing protein DprA [Leisingera aquaemixtae]
MTEEAHSSTHPPLPPTTEDTQFSWLRLLRSKRVGPVTFHRLLAEYGSAQNALDALPEVARSAGIKGYETCPANAVDAEIKAAKAAKARLLCFPDPDYPKLLAGLKDAPPLLWAIGDLSVLERPVIAMVGARNASSLGLRMARSLAQNLGEAGYTVVSGMARGIDTAAHQAALKTGTIAVLAGGADVIYPAENARLAEDICKTGLRLSEQPMGLTPRARDFPKRNRIIAGLARAVVVVEAAAKSGTLITARDALDYGREVLAVPGHPFDARSSGCNRLIRDGAQLVRDAADVLEALPPLDPPPPAEARPSLQEALAELPPPPPQRRSLAQTHALHQQILGRLGPSPTSETELLRGLALPPHELAPALTDLELEGAILRQPGGLLCKAFPDDSD